MSDTLIGIIIGGCIGVIPSLLTVFLELIKTRTQRKHELRMRRIELIDSPRIEALLEYSRQLGALLGDELSEELTFANYNAAFQRASVFAAPDTRSAMQAVNPLLIKAWRDGTSSESLDLVSLPEFCTLNDCLHREIYSPFADTYDPAGYSYQK